MASIYPNRKNGKTVSFKFKAFIGRDANGKQLFKCTTWLPEKSMSESKLIAQAEKEAIIYITKHMKRFTKRVGLPDMSPHDLRHTCASLLIQSGADIKSVQDILGRADASTTLNFYVKSDVETIRAATSKAFDFN